MKKLVLVSLMVMICFSVIGCMKIQRGNEKLSGVSVTEIQDRIKEGRTTKGEIEEWLGPPSTIGKERNGNEYWAYEFMKAESNLKATTFIPVVGGLVGGSESSSENAMLHIEFSSGGVVKSYKYTTS
ncbi:hypothetical protein [Desulfovibrio sp. SGI.169]|uniref:hypothetical protein n=1 Tax=Desulfovibrio sp. SGI.169 TaxID=3420561 RepID=UPI003CFEE542